MGKRKSKNNPSEAQEQKPEEEANGVIVLGVHMHCQGCANKVLKALRGFDGVEEIVTDIKNHKVTVKGKKADPMKVAERLRKKSFKHVVIISPIPKEKKEEKKEEKKKEQPKVVEVVLGINMPCEGCSHEIKYRIHKLQGVHTVETDMAKSLVTVKGVFEPQKLVEYITKKAGKHASIVKQTPPDQKKEGENAKEKKKEDDTKKEANYHIYPPELVYAPQLFSDENPHSCTVM